MKYLQTIKILLLLFLTAHITNGQKLTSSDIDKQLEISDYIKMYDLSDDIIPEQLTLNDIKSFSGKLEENSFLGPDHKDKLIITQFNNEGDKEYIFNISFGVIRYLKVFIESKDSLYNYELGTRLSNQVLADNSDFTGFNLPLPKGNSTLYILIDNDANVSNTNFFIYEKEYLKDRFTISGIYVNILKAILTFLFILSFLLFVVLKKKLFLYNCLIVIGIVSFVESETLLIFHLTESENILYMGRFIGTIVYCVFTLLLVLELFPLKWNTKIINRILYSIVAIDAVSIIILFFVGPSNRFLNNYLFVYNVFIGQSIFLISISICIYNAYKHPTIRNVLISIVQFFLFVSLAIIVTGSSLGVIQRFWMSNLLVYIVTTNQILFFLGLILIKFYSDEKQRNALQNTIYQIKESSNTALLEGELNERKKISQKLSENIGDNLNLLSQKSMDEIDALALNETIEQVRSLSHQLLLPTFETDEFDDVILDLISKYNSDELQCFFNITNWEYVDVKVQQHIYRLLQDILNTLEENKCEGKFFLNFNMDGVYGNFSIEWTSKEKPTNNLFDELIEYIKFRLIAINTHYIVENHSHNYFLNVSKILLSNIEDEASSTDNTIF
ncbi:hypothetical protein KMW28_27430 [Flammeovirga yaeyamensis]|uniref:7TM-DISM receptor extracellular domain-containing protein n=1 Tax=Flammeovirga yaeyamensis TaxID=367791 RepID=A0AAX1NAN7_9BACT|nr:hypothetical protein [Flammeovirga yaeyamensis]MBB3699984.1 hypothetical protein [Flammeovirga yaeyamensis]NMF37577.1 hypothetical protein [Flammeovirga yaeyamensis]QWG04634.1 hypothetical protein KMW28_27430 [Flammeovirga yaeyamensis]